MRHGAGCCVHLKQGFDRRSPNDLELGNGFLAICDPGVGAVKHGRLSGATILSARRLLCKNRAICGVNGCWRGL